MAAQTVTELSSSVRQYYDKLFQDGFLVSVHVSKWGMSTHLDKKDIEYSKDKVLPAIFKLGKKMLINQERLNEFERLESKARRYLDVNSYDFPIADAHFVTKKKIASVLDNLDKIKVEYLALRDLFIKNYEAHKKEMLDAYPKLAAELTPHYPLQKDLAAKFDFAVSLYEIQMPKEMGEVDIQKLITRDKAEAEVKTEFENRLKGHYEQSLVKIETFTQNAATILRSQVAAMCKTVSDKIENKEVVSKRNIEKLREEIANFKTLNFFDDRAVEEELNKLEQVVAGNVNYRTDSEALLLLNQALGNVIEKASNITDLNDISVNYFRAIKI